MHWAWNILWALCKEILADVRDRKLQYAKQVYILWLAMLVVVFLGVTVILALD